MRWFTLRWIALLIVLSGLTISWPGGLSIAAGSDDFDSESFEPGSFEADASAPDFA